MERFYPTKGFKAEDMGETLADLESIKELQKKLKQGYESKEELKEHIDFLAGLLKKAESKIKQGKKSPSLQSIVQEGVALMKLLCEQYEKLKA
jgi:hypothetical protein